MYLLVCIQANMCFPFHMSIMHICTYFPWSANEQGNNYEELHTPIFDVMLQWAFKGKTYCPIAFPGAHCSLPKIWYKAHFSRIIPYVLSIIRLEAEWVQYPGNCILKYTACTVVSFKWELHKDKMEQMVVLMPHLRTVDTASQSDSSSLFWFLKLFCNGN